MIIAVYPDSLGHLELEPVELEMKNLVSHTNKYDGNYIVYLQLEGDIQEFLDTLTMHEQSALNCGYGIDIDIDEHTYRHMLGGQSD
jgi:hypothetical protein